MCKFCKSPAISLLTVISITFISFANNLPFRINLTGSMPRGIYRLTSSAEVHRGDFVIVCLPDRLASFALQRGYLRAGSCRNGTQPLLKQVVAEKGDTVTLTTLRIQVNNETLPYSATVDIDLGQRPLPAALRGVYRLTHHQLWLYGVTSPQSWDSRYFGVIDSSYVMGAVKPLFKNQWGNKQ
jgi:conjugative transfer signal peptidase TraF